MCGSFPPTTSPSQKENAKKGKNTHTHTHTHTHTRRTRGRRRQYATANTHTQKTKKKQNTHKKKDNALQSLSRLPLLPFPPFRVPKAPSPRLFSPHPSLPTTRAHPVPLPPPPTIFWARPKTDRTRVASFVLLLLLLECGSKGGRKQEGREERGRERERDGRRNKLGNGTDITHPPPLPLLQAGVHARWQARLFFPYSSSFFYIILLFFWLVCSELFFLIFYIYINIFIVSAFLFPIAASFLSRT